MLDELDINEDDPIYGIQGEWFAPVDDPEPPAIPCCPYCISLRDR